jgi:hypothetical protein
MFRNRPRLYEESLQASAAPAVFDRYGGGSNSPKIAIEGLTVHAKLGSDPDSGRLAWSAVPRGTATQFSLHRAAADARSLRQ